MVNNNGCRCPEVSADVIRRYPGIENSHTTGVSAEVSTETLRVLIDMEQCPVERRALERVLVNRLHHVS